MASEQSRVGMQLVHDDEAQVGEEGAPRLLPREDREVQHVRIGEDLSRYGSAGEDSGAKSAKTNLKAPDEEEKRGETENSRRYNSL